MNNSTTTKSFNNGIDFSIARGSKVYVVAAGTVSLTGEVPFFGKVVIINHDNGYRSVYASLSDINVTAGDKVKLSQIIGKSGETPDGQALHFELWLNGTPLNPKEWLRF
jgi:murein DD-endopeptidase MepM/ murein hydrolase activator NlpD